MTTTTRQAPRTGGTPPRQGVLAGSATLVRFMLRRDRVRIPVWIGALTATTVGVAANFTQLYPTAAERQAVAATMEGPAGVAMVGPNHWAEYHYGAMMGHQMLWFTAVLAGVMSVLLLVRHTRTEEATGRAELVRASVVGRHAPLAAALALVAGANVALGLLLAVGLGATGIEGITWSGSWLYGAAHAAVGLTFTGVTAIAVQVTEHSRGASGMGLAAVGLAYALRALGDVGGGELSWLTPIGWAQATRVYGDDRWWPLLLALLAGAALVAVAVDLSSRRDVGAGLRAPRPGRRAASTALASPLGLAVRLQRANLLAWVVGLFVLGVMYGSVLSEAEQWLAEIEAMGDILAGLEGTDVVQSFAAMVTAILAIIASAYAVLATQRLRTEESAGRAEPVLATALSRTRWVASHAAVAMAGSVAVLLAAGLGIGSAGAASTGDGSYLPDLVAAALAYAPALWVTAGVAVALFGLLPRALPLTWAVVVYSFVVVYLGGLLGLPAWTQDLSPFGHVARFPADEFALVPLLALTALAAALVALGLAAFRRRDLQSLT